MFDLLRVVSATMTFKKPMISVNTISQKILLYPIKTVSGYCRSYKQVMHKRHLAIRDYTKYLSHCSCLRFPEHSVGLHTINKAKGLYHSVRYTTLTRWTVSILYPHRTIRLCIFSHKR